MTKLRLFFSRGVRRFVADDKGATAIEYGLIGVIIATGIVAAVNLTSASVLSLYQRIAAIFDSL